ncbi:microtubule-associated protein futsch isoform X8 [Drosophila willistoni]|uniref:microtubule-associated protein futsch isoform X8 n=1 Tax=Drosophila willistoni TaxID=7260 RepID=UPI000C26D604|nr:microtubule-associated protein futsch isoform X8 [Drosophila willistoni]
MGDQPKVTTTSTTSAAAAVATANEGIGMAGTTQDVPAPPPTEQLPATSTDLASGPDANADADADGGAAAATADGGIDDAATDAGASSLPPSEIGGGGRATLDTACSEGGGPASSLAGGMVGPPSPLTGCYLLIILGEPHSDEHKDNILQHLLKGFLSWDVSDCHVDLEEELNTITQHAPEGEEARHGERLIQYASENLVTEVLIHPQYNTLIQCMRNLLSSFTRHRHIIHAGYTFTGNGSWILQDGTFSVSDFAEAFQEHDVQRVIRAYADTITMNIHCADAGLWHTLPDKGFARQCRIRINPVDVLDTSSESINGFLDYLAPMVVPTSLRELLETSDVVGNIRFTHPTLYVFPGGQGDAALFGINGFNMLVDGGFNRKACFWDFARHLDRLDAVLMTRLNNSNVQGLGAVVGRKRESHVYPQIGHFFGNVPDRKGLPSPDGDKDRNPLLIDLFERGHSLVSDLKSLDLKPQSCYRNQDPINLYHKVGHGTLDMYVISPARDSKEVKEFMQKWHAGDQRLFASRDTKEFNFPLQNLVSICALLVWQPANPDDTITRILFPGSTPDFKIQEGLEKLKHLEFMKHSTCTAKSIAPAIQTVSSTRKTLKSAIEAAPAPPSASYKPVKFGPVPSAAVAVQHQQDNKAKEAAAAAAAAAEEAAVPQSLGIKVDSIDTDEPEPEPAVDTGDEAVHVEPEADTEAELEAETVPDTEADNKDAGEEKKVEVIIIKPTTGQKDAVDAAHIEAAAPGKSGKPPKGKTEKPRAEVKPVVRSRIDTKPPKSMDRKLVKRDDKKSSPTATPAASRTPGGRDVKPKLMTRTAATRSSPSSTPAKSAKEANNRKVLESKQQAAAAASARQTAASTKRIAASSATSSSGERKFQQAETKTSTHTTVAQRKPISRRPRGVSPSKRAPAPGSPIKSAKPKAEIKKSRLDKGGTTDSSLVSTPSADDATAAKKLQELTASQELELAEKQRELDDLKEEQEVVREIEAVFSRDEMKRQQQIKAELREMAKQDSTTEADEEEEYLIIEKEEVEQYTEDSIIEQESSMTKEEEIQKHQRDSQESEKKRKKSAEEEIEAAIAKVEAAERKARLEDSHDHQTVSTPEKSEIKAELQEIIATAKDIIVKSRTDEQLAKPTEEEYSSPTPEEKISKRTSDTKDEPIEIPEALPVNLQESLPEEKFSATIESGATTAPTLPEDERIPLDQIKEDLVIEEKYVKEETKEVEAIVTVANAEVPVPALAASIAAADVAFVPIVATKIPVLAEPQDAGDRVLPKKMTFEAQQNLMRDVIKTPDEVADLPVHEEADLCLYEKDSHISHKEEAAKEEKETDDEKDAKEPELEVQPHFEDVATPKTEPPKPTQENAQQSTILTNITETKELTVETEQSIQTAVVTNTEARPQEKAAEKDLKKSVSTPEEKEASDITSEDELPAQLVQPSALPTKVKEREDTTSLESPDTIEEAIEVEMQVTETEIQKEQPVALTESATPQTSIHAESSKITQEKSVKDQTSNEKVTEDSQPESDKDEKSPFASKEASRPLSVADSVKDEAVKPESTPADKSKDPSRRESVAESIQDEKSPLASKVASRPQSVADSNKEEAEKSESTPADKSKDPSRRESVVESVKDEKSPIASKDTSRPQSVADSIKDETEKPERTPADKSKDASRRASVAESVKAESVKDEKSPLASKDASRPQSVADSIKDETEKSDGKPADKSKDTSRRESVAESVKVESVKDEKSPLASKDASRPQSVTESIKDETVKATGTPADKSKEPSRRESVAESVKAEGIKDEKSPLASKEVSRPESVADSVKDEAEKPESTIAEKSKDPSRRESVAESVKDEKSPIASKDTSRPQSVAESIKDEAEKPESTTADKSKEPSRRESVAESVKAESVKDEKSTFASMEVSRPESVADSVKAEAEKSESTIADKSKDPSRRESLVESVQDEKSPIASKYTSRPQSVADSIKDETEKPESTPDDKSKEPSRRESVAESVKAESVKDEKSPPASKEVSRPESVADSAKAEAEKPEKTTADKSKDPSRRESVAESVKAESVQDEKSPLASKEMSRPESVADSVKAEAEKPESTIADKSKDPSRRESVAEDEKPVSLKDEKSPLASKDASRPQSVADSIKNETEQPEGTPADKSKEPSRRESISETVKLESVKDEKSPLASKDASRPQSVADSIKDETEKPEGTPVDKSKDPSRRESVAEDEKPVSLKDVKSPLASKDASRPQSVADSIKDETEKPEGTPADKSKEPSRRESVSETVKLESVKDEKSPLASKDASRPQSVADSIKDETEKPEGTPVDKSKDPSRRESVAEDEKPVSLKDEKSPLASKDASRPQSVADSIKDETEKPEGTPADKSKDPSRRESVAEDVKPESVKDEKSPLASKDASRPQSVADSVKDEAEKLESIPADKSKDPSRRESVAEDVKPESVKDEKSPLASKDVSRPESVADSAQAEAGKPESTSADKSKEPSRRESVAESVRAESVKDEKSPLASKDASRPQSVADSIKDEIEKPEGTPADKSKDPSRRESVAEDVKPESVKDEKSPLASKDASRPQSVADSVKDDAEKPESTSADKSKEPSRRESVSESIKAESVKDEKSPLASKDASRPQSVADSVKDDAEKPESTSADKSKEPSRRESIVESVKDEKSSLASNKVSRSQSVADTGEDETEKLEISRADESSSNLSGATEEISRVWVEKTTSSGPVDPIVSSSMEKSVTEFSDFELIEKSSLTLSLEATQLKGSLSQPECSEDLSGDLGTASSPIEEAPKDFNDVELGPSSGLALSLKEAKGNLPTLSSPVDVADGDFSQQLILDTTTEKVLTSQPAEHSKVTTTTTVSSPVDEAPESALWSEEIFGTASSPHRESSESTKPESVKDENSPLRPQSVADSAKDEAEKPESTSADKSKDPSRRESNVESVTAESVKDEKSPLASKDVSRPQSVADIVKDETEIPKTTPAEKSKEPSRPESVAESVKSENVKEEECPLESKEISRSGSAVESITVGSKEQSRRESINEACKQEDAKDAPMEVSRPESVLESIKDKSEKPESIRDEKSQETSRRESTSDIIHPPILSPQLSVAASATDKQSKESSRPESIKDDKSPTASRPQSVTETVSSPIEEGPKDISSLNLNLSAGEDKGKLPTLSSPVDVAEGDFSQSGVAQSSPKSPSLSQPAELSKAGASLTVSSPVDEAPKLLESDSVKEHIISTAVTGSSDISEANQTITSILETSSKKSETSVESLLNQISKKTEETLVSLEKKTESTVESVQQFTKESSEQLTELMSLVDNKVSKTTETIASKIIDTKEAISENITELVSKTETTTESTQGLDLSGFSELRETHITTVGSPEFTVTICERDETILHDIKEEDEEHRFSPPTDLGSTLPQQPVRPLSPREEEVAKIVADVAKVLKSDKDITDIIPDFNEKELEEKLKGSEDICSSGEFDKTLEIDTIKVDIESEKSSPDQKSGPVSIEEKDKIEQSEKAQLQAAGNKITTEFVGIESSLASRPESVVDQIEEVCKSSKEQSRSTSQTSIREETKSVDSKDISLSGPVANEKEIKTSRPTSSASQEETSGSHCADSILSSCHESKKEEKSTDSTTTFSKTVVSQTHLKEESLSESLSSSLKVEDSSRRESLSSLLTEKELISKTSSKVAEKVTTSSTVQHEELLTQSEECSSESIVSEIQTTSTQKGTTTGITSTTDTTNTSTSTIETDETVKDNLKETVAEFLATEKIVSAKESFIAEATKSTEESIKKGISIGTSQKPMFVGTDESRRESLLSHTSDSRHTHSDPEDDGGEDEGINLKEGRSKSIATIMMTSIYKPSEEISNVATLQEEEYEQEQEITKTQTQTQTQTQTTTLLESNKQTSSKSKVESITLTQVDIQSEAEGESESEVADRKTPPTAPVSPSVKPSTASAPTSVAVSAKSESIASTSGPLSPKDISGKSSPGALTSESQSIPTPLGRESHTESTSESSPKPTSPFPRVSKDELKSLTGGDSDTIIEASAPRDLESSSAALGGSTEKIITTTITTVTKVISSDGKEIVTEQKTVTTTDSSEPDGEKVVVTTTRTTSESERDQILPKEVALLRGIYRSSTPGSEDDEELPGSPRSASYELQHSSSGISKRSDLDADDSQDDIIPPLYGSEEHSTARALPVRTADPMATSFYGALPDSFECAKLPSEPIPIRGNLLTDSPPASQSSESVESSSQTWAGHKFLDEADNDFQKALDEHVQARGVEVMSSVTAKYSYSPSKAEEVEQIVSSTAERQRFPLSDVQRVRTGETSFSSTSASETTGITTESGIVTTTTTTTTAATTTTTSTTGTLPKDRLEEWGKPLGLPSPAPIEGGSDIRTTPKKERRLVATKTRLNNEKNLRKRSESPNKAKKPAPVYVDLTYVPHNGNSYYAHVDFFKRVRARYYVFSGTEPSRQVYDALLEAKQTWEDKELEVTIIPTYDTDVLGYWVAENEELLAKHRIDLSPSASRCTINLQDHETSCSAYRLEF